MRKLQVQQELVPLIKGDLRPYQLKGIKWMVSLWNNGLNGILADQMGLGKTVRSSCMWHYSAHHAAALPAEGTVSFVGMAQRRDNSHLHVRVRDDEL